MMKAPSLVLIVAWLICIFSPLSNAVEMSNSSRDVPLNLIPMYGHPSVQKSPAQKAADEDFLRCILVKTPDAPASDDGCEHEFSTKVEASKALAGVAFQYYWRGDLLTAMRRFNQAWLLNPENYQIFWGFGLLLVKQDRFAEGLGHYETALNLIDDPKNKPYLLNDIALAYSRQGVYETDSAKVQTSFAKSNALLEEAAKLDPENGRTYTNWALSLLREGNYTRSWEMLKKARTLKDCGCAATQELVEKGLFLKMPELQNSGGAK
ncbi:MAG: hypothetical protein PHU06_09760 [Gallionella sp.]|nr:hypothetical protein [Gallionella sp.]